MAVAQHTEWEKKQLESIELLLKNAIRAIDDFIEKEKKLVNRDDSGREDVDSSDWLKFRGIMLDLYSVLDYVWYLLYCHFSNKGRPDFTEKGCELGFPYRKKGIKTSQTSPQQDKSQEFVKDKLKKIFRDNVLILGEETHFWKEIGKVIVSVQPKLRVGASGAAIGDIHVQGDEESLHLLHFYRNCAAHKDLITFMSRKSWVEINQTTREIRLVTERKDDHDGYFYRDLEKGFWIQMPGSITSSTSVNETRFLIEVLDQLRKFVVNTASRLLRSALLLPSAKSILEQYIDGCEVVTDLNSADSEDCQKATVTATVNGREIVETSTNKNQAYAEEEACVKIIRSLQQMGTVPNAPYSCFTSHFVRPLSDIEKLEKMPSATYEELLEDWKQKLEARNMEVVVEHNKHLLVTNKESGAPFIKLCSDEPSSDVTKEAAAKKLIDEALRLGLIEIKDVDHPPIPVITVTQTPQGKTFQQILNEFKQKMENLSMILNLNYSTCEVEQPTFETELSLTISQRGTNRKVLRLFTDKQRGQGKSKSKEAAAQKMCDECVKRGILRLTVL